jgi:hypothetical protein
MYCTHLTAHARSHVAPDWSCSKLEPCGSPPPVGSNNPTSSLALHGTQHAQQLQAKASCLLRQWFRAQVAARHGHSGTQAYCTRRQARSSLASGRMPNRLGVIQASLKLEPQQQVLHPQTSKVCYHTRLCGWCSECSSRNGKPHPATAAVHRAMPRADCWCTTYAAV